MASSGDRVPQLIEGRDQEPGIGAVCREEFTWQGFVVGVCACSALVCGIVGCILSYPPDSVVGAHRARYIGSLSASFVLIVATFISICSYSKKFCCGDDMREFIEKSGREIWSLRAVLANLLLVIGVGLNFLLVEVRYRLWVMFLHSCGIFFLSYMQQLRIPFGLGSLWLGSTCVVAWDANGDYAASGIVTGLILVMLIVGLRPSPAGSEEKAAEAATNKVETAAAEVEAAATRVEAARAKTARAEAARDAARARAAAATT
ncbi:hypothetical protein LINGRAHAP2_LOCUS12941 [Linum grandiflorum]